ncbi:MULTISPECIES: pseudaminic acid synthase [unclassified Lentimonas]|uniref:pseudaminic acid synthase n=1 Tax=unclassified Lentimonas TaxID=2630993 RepID=UPI001322B9A7|nr:MULTISPECIES: pseudaminic acid synthase [unclassified Lentimonas]CAA6676532.1 N-acetylneuraminate synthase (EC [Lentimonas sp. CC4]CAA6685372.1 N-acetylneuraminate synthase (EC [Lentimonas sp. CC6]CAA7074904.1 N-acetylneuraminate synthase (EC [Lentimonas sp. CC4]CAA7169529.1 N-acetylneuraminate synthase (EC [Lentimonas sp. CC21]CAA7182709.1 N-acetylneuraminate synthase (EC [Lentimonas sp. CC8]
MTSLPNHCIEIDGRLIGAGHPTYVIAEISANHNQNIDEAIDLIQIAANSGADAVKIQTYTPDTMTIQCENDYFKIGKDTLWEGRSLYELYGDAYTPWEWLPELQKAARNAKITLFSTPFDSTSVNFLEQHNVPAHKIASFELTDHPLLATVAQTGKPVILSTGLASLEEITDAVEVLRTNGCEQLALLKCTSAYPAPPEEANLARIPHMQETFSVPVGLSDHTMGTTVSALAVSLGACIIEKHFTKSRAVPGPDSAFSLEPDELKAMIEAVRIAEKAIGHVTYDLTEMERNSRTFRRSIFAVKDIQPGEEINESNVRIIRPSYGLAPKYMNQVLGLRSKGSIRRGTPLSWDLINHTSIE